MTDSRSRLIHVERTDDPAVLRWVLHHPTLASAPSGRRQAPPGSSIGRLIADRSITDLAIRDGDALIRTTEPARWPTVAPRIRAALLATLDQLEDGTAGWLLDADTTDDTPSIAEIQALVDRSAGAPMSAHGGAMIVTAVDATTVHLRASGACRGCHQTDDTLVTLIRPAVHAAYPAIVEVVVDPGPADQPLRQPATRRVLAPRRVRRPGDGTG